MGLSDEKKDRLMQILGWWVNEFKTQVAHMTIIFAMIICLFIETPRSAIIWTTIFAIYYLVLYITGKNIFELVFDLDDRSNFKENKRKFKKMYLIGTLLLFIVGAVTTGFLTAFIIVIIIGTITFLYFMFDVDSDAGVLFENDCRENNKPINNYIKLQRFSDEHPIIYEGIYYLSLFCLILIPTIFLSCAWWIKALIVIGYIAIVPVISLWADSGASITEIFNFREY